MSASSSAPVRVGVVGLGYWGPNLARNFEAIPDATLVWCCDESAEARDRAAARFPNVSVSGDLDELLADSSLDAIAVATPVPTHAEVATRVLEAGKHCFVEKPLAQAVGDAERAVTSARGHGRILRVGPLLG